MIIEPRIRISDEELAALKSSESMDVELALEIVGRVRRAIRCNSFNVVQFVTDHVTNAEGELVDAGEVEIRTDAHGNDVTDELNNLASELKMFARHLDQLVAAGAIPKEVPNRLREILETNGQ